MNGISGHCSIMMDEPLYNNLSKIDKLRHDLGCLNAAGWSGPSSGQIYLNNIKARDLLKDDIRKQILNIERNQKIKKLNNYA